MSRCRTLPVLLVRISVCDVITAPKSRQVGALRKVGHREKRMPIGVGLIGLGMAVKPHILSLLELQAQETDYDRRRICAVSGPAVSVFTAVGRSGFR